MIGRRFVTDGKDWHVDVVQHWPPGGPDDRPLAYDVFFYDPADPNRWVGNPWVPAEAADLSDPGPGRLFREATLRTWRDTNGRYWRIRVVRTGAVGFDREELLPDVFVTFASKDASRPRRVIRGLAEMRPVGMMDDDELERLLPRSDTETLTMEKKFGERAPGPSTG